MVGDGRSESVSMPSGPIDPDSGDPIVSDDSPTIVHRFDPYSGNVAHVDVQPTIVSPDQGQSTIPLSQSEKIPAIPIPVVSTAAALIEELPTELLSDRFNGNTGEPLKTDNSPTIRLPVVRYTPENGKPLPPVDHQATTIVKP